MQGIESFFCHGFLFADRVDRLSVVAIIEVFIIKSVRKEVAVVRVNIIFLVQ